jgi:hypothetical protein
MQGLLPDISTVGILYFGSSILLLIPHLSELPLFPDIFLPEAKLYMGGCQSVSRMPDWFSQVRNEQELM